MNVTGDVSVMTKPKLPPAPESVGRVAIDFDGVLVEGEWPSPRIGKPIGKGIALAIYYHGTGREVVIYTARPESHKERIFAWLRMTSLQDVIYDVVCNKPVADLYVDDKAWNPWKDSYFPGAIKRAQEARESFYEDLEGVGAATSETKTSSPGSSKAASPSTEPEFYTGMEYVNG